MNIFIKICLVAHIFAKKQHKNTCRQKPFAFWVQDDGGGGGGGTKGFEDNLINN